MGATLVGLIPTLWLARIERSAAHRRSAQAALTESDADASTESSVEVPVLRARMTPQCSWRPA